MGKLRNWMVVATCIGFITLASNARAVAFNIADGYTLGTVSASLASGNIPPGSDISGYVNQLVSLGQNGSTTLGGAAYARSGNSFNPLDTAGPGSRYAYAVDRSSPAPTVTINLGTGDAQYLLASYRGASYLNQVWYIGNLSGTATIPLSYSGYFLSSATIFCPKVSGPAGQGPASVPDAGSTSFLLGSVLAGLAFVKRRIQ